MDTLADLDFNYYHRVYTTVHEMMQDRGYAPKKKRLERGEYVSKMLGLLAEDNDDPFMFVDKLSLIFQHMSDTKRRLMVYFYLLDTKLRKVEMEHIHKLMKERKTNELVIIARDQVTPRVSSVLTILGPHAQVFDQDDLICNPTLHQLTSKHVLLSAEEKEKIIDYYKAQDRQIPAIFSNEIIARYYNWDIGSLIKIIRPENEISYRIVVVPSGKK